MLEVNVLSVVITMYETLKYFDHKSGERIINIVSTSAHRVPQIGKFYTATKAALKCYPRYYNKNFTTKITQQKLTAYHQVEWLPICLKIRSKRYQKIKI